MSKDQQKQFTTRQRYRTTNSLISNSSDSYSSVSSFEIKEPKDQFFYDSNISDPLNQLLDDLTIIDDFIPDYNDLENEIELHYERQVADAARNVARKQYIVHQLCEFQQEHFLDFDNFMTFYMEPLTRWVNDPDNLLAFQKSADSCSLQSLLELNQVFNVLTRAHKEFYLGIKERLLIWGPTQFLSDLFNDFFEKSIFYDNYLDIFPSLILTIDTLYRRSPAFSAFFDNCMKRANIPDIKDILFYLKSPLIQLPNYLNYITSLNEVTDPTHPDYKPLVMLYEKFSRRESHWKPTIKDRLAHMRVLEAARSIQETPAHVTINRRLLISGMLFRVDLSNPQSSADARTYLLYNDMLIFTQKLKLAQTNQAEKLVYKGAIPLSHTEVMPLSHKTISKISEIKKSAGLAFLRNKADKNNKTTSVYGFELHVNDTVVDRQVQIMESRFNNIGSINMYTVPGDSSISNKKVLIMRTQSEAEQNAWIHLLSKVTKELARKK